MATNPKRLITLKTVLGSNHPRAQDFHAREELGRLFEFEVHALSDDPAVDLAALPGTHATVELELPSSGQTRHFDGIVVATGLAGGVGRTAQVRLVLRPWLWLLTRRVDTRIFQAMTVKDILTEVFSAYRHDVAFELAATYPTVEYCVQYRETDFDFVSRLMESQGIYYFFEHSSGRHVMKIVDSMASHVEFAGYGSVPMRNAVDEGRRPESISQWLSQIELQSTAVALNSYDFTAPGKALLARQGSALPERAGTLEVYDPPGDYVEPGEGERLAKLRVEEIDAWSHQITGAGHVRGLAVGCRFKPDGHPVASENVPHLVVSTTIAVTGSGYESGQEAARFDGAFTAMPASRPFRPRRSTPRPRVPGPQTAVVVGKSGDEIWTDEYGRIKVQFHWDREGKKDQNSSCWVRVATPVAGKGFGMIAVPRVGQEVVVSFLDGDPDRPLVTGSVYNASQTVPYTLPDQKTVWTLKSQSSKGGQGFNELRFEDKKGSEEVWLHAEKDFHHRVKGQAWTSIGGSEYRVVNKSLQEEIKEDVLRTVGKDATELFGGRRHVVVGGDQACDVGGEWGLKVATDLSQEAGTGISAKAGTELMQKAGANIGIEAGANAHLKGGAMVVVEAGAMLTLKCGSASVVLSAAGVSITGTMVMINSGGSAGSGSGAKPKAPKKPKKPDKPQIPKDPLG